MMAFSLFTGIFTRPPQHEWHMYAKTPYSKKLAICGLIVSLPRMYVPVMRWKIPIMSLKCCEKSYISCRLYCVCWRKYLNCSDAFTRCLTYWHTCIVFLYTWLHYLRSRVKGLSSICNSGFIHCQYHTGWTALYMVVRIGGTYALFCIRMA